MSGLRAPLFYWFTFRRRPLRVFMPAMSAEWRCWKWRGIYGVSFGRWFVGAIQSDADVSTPTARVKVT